MKSFKFQFAQLKENFSAKTAKMLPADDAPSLLVAPNRPQHIPDTAQWLGGIGEGGWFNLLDLGNKQYRIDRYNPMGLQQQKTITHCIEQFDIHKPYSADRYLL